MLATSVRAQMIRSPSRRASSAAASLAIMSAIGTTCLPGR